MSTEPLFEGTLPGSFSEPFRLVIDTIPGLVWSSLPDGYIDFLNRRWLEYTGLSLADARGWGWRSAIHPDDLSGLERYWRSILATGEPGEYEARLRSAAGTYRWFLFRAVPLRDDSGTIGKWYGQTTDIDDRRRAEALLAGEKQLLEMIASGCALPAILDALCRTVEELLPQCLCGILLVDASRTLLHHGAGPSLPSAYNEALHGRAIDPEAGPCGMAAFLGQQVLSLDVDSESRWRAGWSALAAANDLRACWSTPIVAGDGAVLGTFALYWRQPGGPNADHRNLIERMTHLAAVAMSRKRSEDALSEVRFELAHVARVATLGELAATIAHEINQPLGAIVNNANATIRWLAANKADEARASVALVVSDGHRASGILSRIRAMLEKSPAQKGALDLSDALSEVLTLAGSQAERHGVRIDAHLPADLPRIWADRVQVQQVALNLVMNAIDAMAESPEGKRILTVTACRTGVNTVRIEFRDRGCGFTQEQSGRLFDPFYTTKPKGLGMGLPISRSIVQAHEGQLWATPNPDCGTTFHCTLPVTPGESA